MHCSGSVLKDGETLSVEFALPLFPLVLVELLEALAAQHFQLLVSLAELLLNCVFIAGISLANGILLISLVPLSITVNSLQSA